MSDQVKFLTLNSTTSIVNTSHQARSSPAPSTSGNISQLLRHPNLPPVNQPQTSYQQPLQQQYQQQQQQQQQPPTHAPWFTSNIVAPQASHPTAPPPVPAQAPQQQMMRQSPPVQNEEWDDTYLAVLGSQDSRQLRELLARSNPDAIMPMKGNGPLSQAVVLTLVHRVRSSSLS